MSVGVVAKWSSVPYLRLTLRVLQVGNPSFNRQPIQAPLPLSPFTHATDL